MADTKWSDFPAASSVADADITAVVQSGTNKKSAMSVIKAYLLAAFNSVYVPLTRTLTIGGSAKTLAADRTWATTDILDSLGTAQGDVIYRGSANWVVLTPGTDGNQLTTHGAGANPTWDSGTVVTPAALTKTDDTNVTVTLGGTPTTALLQATSLTLGWTGTLAAARGGTGVGSLGNITKVDDTNVTLTLGGTPTGAVITSTSLTLGWTGTLAAGRGGTGVSSLGNITKTDDTNVTLTLGGTPTGAVINATSFTLGWTGTLSQARGGFGKSTASTTDGQIPIGKTSDGSWNVNTITAGTGISITNGAGTITIVNTSPSSGTSMTGHGDSNYTILSSDRVVVTNAAFTAPRTWTLPAATAVSAGTSITIADLQKTVTATNTLAITAAGSDKIWPPNVATYTLTAPSIGGGGPGVTLTSDGTSKWFIGVVQPGANVSSGQFQQCISSVWGVSNYPLPTSAGTSNKVLQSDGTAIQSQFLKGTTTNDSAASGEVGETIQSLVASGSAVSLTTATGANIASISLTPGDWDVSGNVNCTETTSTVTARSAGITTTSATVPTDGSEAYCGVQSTVTSEINSITLPTKRISLSITTTIYLVAKATFSAGTCAGFGAIVARRVR